MAICRYCNQEMMDHVGCTQEYYDDFPDKIRRKRLVSERYCQDCCCPEGTLHHPGCHNEDCPKCGCQAISCDCIEGE